jgi:hypothetical protein
MVPGHLVLSDCEILKKEPCDNKIILIILRKIALLMLT